MFTPPPPHFPTFPTMFPIVLFYLFSAYRTTFPDSPPFPLRPPPPSPSFPPVPPHFPRFSRLREGAVGLPARAGQFSVRFRGWNTESGCVWVLGLQGPASDKRSLPRRMATALGPSGGEASGADTGPLCIFVSRALEGCVCVYLPPSNAFLGCPQPSPQVHYLWIAFICFLIRSHPLQAQA